MVQGSKVQNVQEPLIRSTIGLASARPAFDPAAIKSFKRFQRFCRPVIYNLRKEKLCRCHDLSVDEILNFMALIDQIPTHHPLVGSH